MFKVGLPKIFLLSYLYLFLYLIMIPGCLILMPEKLFAEAAPPPLAKLKDPTQPPEKFVVVKDEKAIEAARIPELTAILISGPHRTAVINDRLVKEGDKIGNHRVKAIGRYSVKLIDQVKKEGLTLYILGSPPKEKKNGFK